MRPSAIIVYKGMIIGRKSRYILRTILREGPSFIAKKVFYAAQFLRECARADDCARDLAVIHYLLCVDRLTHVKVDSQAKFCSVSIIHERETTEKTVFGETYLIGIIDENNMRKRKR